MKELEMNEMEKKANRIVNRKENEVDDELPPFSKRNYEEI